MMILIVTIILLLMLISGIGGWFFLWTRPFDLLSVVCIVVYVPVVVAVLWWLFCSDDFSGSIIEEIRAKIYGLGERILCWLGIHKVGKWLNHPTKKGYIINQCEWCSKIVVRRLFG